MKYIEKPHTSEYSCFFPPPDATVGSSSFPLEAARRSRSLSESFVPSTYWRTNPGVSIALNWKNWYLKLTRNAFDTLSLRSSPVLCVVSHQDDHRDGRVCLATDGRTGNRDMLIIPLSSSSDTWSMLVEKWNDNWGLTSVVPVVRWLSFLSDYGSLTGKHWWVSIYSHLRDTYDLNSL